MYYEINEDMARRAHESWSMSDYVAGSVTAEYRSMVDKAAAVAEEQIRVKPDFKDEIEDILDRYSKRLAEWFAAKHRCDLMCPSILIAGGSNFPVAKKKKQNERMDALWKKFDEIEGMIGKMQSIGKGGIKANDEKAIYKLQKKLEDRKTVHETMKAANAYYKKHGDLAECDEISDSVRRALDTEHDAAVKAGDAARWVPFEKWQLQNNNAEIHRIEKRIAEIQEVKDEGNKEVETGIEGLQVIEDSETMRIRFVFEGKLDGEIRDVMKRYGFRWAPSCGAWQRQLTANGRFAAKQALNAIKMKSH